MAFGFHPKSEFKKGNKINLNKHNSPETEFKLGHLVSNTMRKKMSDAHQGKLHSEETKKKISVANKGKIKPPLSEEHKRNMSLAKRGKKLTKEHIKNCLRRRTPSSLEEKFQNIVNKYNLPYKYVGNGKFFIENFNPDFINTNHEKIAVEVYARYYKLRNNISIKEWKEKRSKIFKEYGWKIIFFNEIEVNEDNVIAKMKVGN